MTIQKSNIFTIAGVVLIVFSSFEAGKALSNIATILYIGLASDVTNSPAFDTAKVTITSAIIFNVVSFLVLFFAGRWMLRGPKLLNRWAMNQQGERQDNQ